MNKNTYFERKTRMKKLCMMLVIVMGVGLAGCEKSTPTAKPTTDKTVETARPAAEEVKQAMITTAADVDLTSSTDKLKEQAKLMSMEALKATAEKYKAQFLSTKSNLETKMDLLSKIPPAEKLSAEAQTLTKDIQTLTSTLASLKDRLAIYVDVLKAQGVDISSFAL
jgi:hypothetical protein